jgi:IPT/TIG domain
MRPHRFILAAGFIAAGSILPAGLALAQGDRGGPTVRVRRPLAVRTVQPRSGAPGTTVTIRGSFPPNARLLFDGRAIPVQRADRRTIIFAVPDVQRGRHALIVRAGGADVTAGEFVVDRDGSPAGRPGAPGGADRYKARWDRAGWVELGRQQVLGRRDTDVIKVGRREGRFDRLMVVVEDSDLEMMSMRIRFAGGDVLEPNVRHLFRENARTRSIDLPGERRGVVIDQIEFRYANLPGGGRASVSVWGHEDRGGRPPYRGPKPIIIDYWPRHGSVGTEVTIHGRRFGSQLQVLFGNQVITPSRRADNFLTFKVPRHRGDAFVSLRVSGWRDLPIGRFDVSGRNAQLERERRREARRVSAERWWQARRRQIARNAAAREAALRAEEARLAREREARRKRRIAELRRRWEQRFLVQQDVRVELALHAERNARLERMLRLAEAGDFGPLAIRIRMMVDFEEMRHQQRMDDLKAAYARR